MLCMHILCVLGGGGGDTILFNNTVGRVSQPFNFFQFQRSCYMFMGQARKAEINFLDYQYISGTLGSVQSPSKGGISFH